MNYRVFSTNGADSEAMIMFLEQFLIGNLWNACLICVMLGLKWLLRNRLSLVCSGLFAFLVFPPKWDLVCVSTRKICWTAGICHFEYLHQYRCSCYRGRMASGYNRADCPSRKQPPYFYCFVSLDGWRFGIHRRVSGWNLEAPHDKASFSGTILCVP